MKRYSAYDPPEYVDWAPDPEVTREYRETIARDPAREAIIGELSREKHLALYAGMLRFRLHDIALKRWVRQGVISKAWLGTGEEATTVGAVHALQRRGAQGDVVGPMIRNAGACHEMGMPVADMLRGYLATGDSPTAGKDLHIGGREYGIVAPVSMVGGLAPVMAGYALGFKMRGEARVALTWVGDGATKTGEVHEALNFATVRGLPAVYIIQNNQVALGTYLHQHHAAPDFRGWAKMYGARGAECEGNNVLDVYAATRQAVELCRSGQGPVFLTAHTFRMGGHATHDEREAREMFDAETFAYWGKRDPVGCYEEYLIHQLPMDLHTGERSAPGDASEVNREVLEGIEAEVEDEIDSALEEALASGSAAMPHPEDAGKGVYEAPSAPASAEGAPWY